jgi:putative nucleotidyltransferase with HDIG domain
VDDEWGITLSGYAPIRNGQGKSIAILGVDMDATDIYNARRVIYGRILIILALGLVISLLIALILSRRISGPIEKLTGGTRHIAEGDMSYRIAERGVNEIRELARSFNEMTGSLSEARKKLRDYFIRVVQSFVLSLEAKDPYTGGHSERVAAYAGRIAAGMGLPADRVTGLEEAALLHDIGKMGVAEIILNKTEPLAQTEWDSIRSHPAVGGRILEPVLEDEELLSVVTGHHERMDGTGYPLGLAAERITIYARITAVADTYDAMTSSRAYRKALSRETAIAELLRIRGTQLDPQVVDAFVEILRGEEG